MSPQPQYWAVYLTWEELFGNIPTEEEVRQVLLTLNRQSTLVLLARLGIHLFLDQFRRNASETTYLQSFLISNFWDDEVLNRAKEKMGAARIDFRRAFHSQQILTLLKWATLHARANGGFEPDTDKDARFLLGRCLLKTSDLLFSRSMRSDIDRDRRSPSAKKYLRLQLALGAGLEVTNPPPVVNGVARSTTIFEDILKGASVSVDLNSALKQRTGVSLDSYVDLTLGALAIYLCRTQKDLIDNSSYAVLNPTTFFGSSVPTEITERFWDMESCTIDELATTLSAPNELVECQDFTAFRMKPFLRLNTGSVICINPGFVREKLEIGLFWTIVNSLQGEDRQKAFDTWGELFETYVNQKLATAVDPGKERYIPRPDFEKKKQHHEAFDGILVSGRVCAVFECKGGFLPNNAKYAENLDHFVEGLEKKFATDAGAGLEQLTRKIAQVFAGDKKEQRYLENIDLSLVDIVVPVLVVQDNFVSSIFTLPWLAKTFRDAMRKKSLNRRVVLTSLLVLHVEDVENVHTYVKAGDFSLAECLLYAGKKGDPGPSRLFAFADLLRLLLRRAWWLLTLTKSPV
jgi:hypothetical protein